jgi:hypothetical protein
MNYLSGLCLGLSNLVLIYLLRNERLHIRILLTC